MWWLRQVRWPECLSLCLCIQRHMSDLVFNVLLLPWALCSWSYFFLSSPTLCLPLSRYLYFLLFQQTVLSIFPMGDSNIWIRLSMSEWHFACLITEAHPASEGHSDQRGAAVHAEPKKNSLNLCCRHRTTSTLVLLSPTECLSRFISILLCFKSYKSANETTIIKSECISSLSFSSI